HRALSEHKTLSVSWSHYHSFYAANGISTDDIVALGLVYQF
ncbi:hypothetical protein, partial [Shigella flexneri]